MARSRDETGASSVEYALIAVAVAALVVAVVFVLGGYVKGMFDNTCTSFSQSGWSTAGGTCS
jgi:pilus assembly protein Flp/PilA